MITKSPDAEVWLVETSALLLQQLTPNGTTNSDDLGSTRLLSAVVDDTFTVTTMPPSPSTGDTSPACGGTSCVVPIVVVLVSLLAISVGFYIYFSRGKSRGRNGGSLFNGDSVSLDEYFNAHQEYQSKMMEQQQQQQLQTSKDDDDDSDHDELLFGPRNNNNNNFHNNGYQNQHDAFFGKSGRGQGDADAFHGRPVSQMNKNNNSSNNNHQYRHQQSPGFSPRIVI